MLSDFPLSWIITLRALLEKQRCDNVAEDIQCLCSWAHSRQKCFSVTILHISEHSALFNHSQPACNNVTAWTTRDVVSALSFFHWLVLDLDSALRHHSSPAAATMRSDRQAHAMVIDHTLCMKVWLGAVTWHSPRVKWNTTTQATHCPAKCSLINAIIDKASSYPGVLKFVYTVTLQTKCVFMVTRWKR